MKYKALMSDIDGTLIPYDKGAMPSQRVLSAIQKASEKVTVCVVTGRSYASSEEVLHALNLYSGLAVINNGAQVLDLGKQTIIYEKLLGDEAEAEIRSYLLGRSIPFHINTLSTDPEKRKRFAPSGTAKLFVPEVFSEKEVNQVITDLSHIPSITLTKGKHHHPDLFSLTICHAEATKLHGVEQVAKVLGVNTHEMIGIGDGYNDFPLLMACGLKVAMGNAVEDLKAIADYIAPPVREDGVADVIEKYVLQKSIHH